MMVQKPTTTLRHKNVKRLFTKEEDQMIVSLVKIYGTSSWVNVSKCLVNRTSRQCRERWKYYLAPGIRNDPWTEEEDEMLKQCVKEFGPKWARISGLFENRTDTNIKNRWVLLQRALKRNKLYSKENTSSDDNMANSITTHHIDVTQECKANDALFSLWIQNIPPFHMRQNAESLPELIEFWDDEQFY